MLLKPETVMHFLAYQNLVVYSYKNGTVTVGDIRAI